MDQSSSSTTSGVVPSAPTTATTTNNSMTPTTNGNNNVDAKARFTDLFNEYVQQGMAPNVAAATALKTISTQMSEKKDNDNNKQTEHSGEGNDATATNVTKLLPSRKWKVGRLHHRCLLLLLLLPPPPPPQNDRRNNIIPGRGKKMNAIDKVIIINQQDSLIKTAENDIGRSNIKSKDANGILDFKSFLNIVDGTSVNLLNYLVVRILLTIASLMYRPYAMKMIMLSI